MATTTDGLIHWRASLDEALQEAGRSDKAVLLDFFSATWGGCKRLDAVTYTDATAVRTIEQSVIPVQVPTLDPASAPIVKRFQQVWTPTIMLLSSEGNVCDEWNGYLPPGLYVPRLLLGLGKVGLKQDHLEDAARCFDEITVKYPLSDVAPEAAYWAAVSRYKGSHEAEDLLGGWKVLQSRYPESPWRVRQSFTEP